MPDHHDPAAVAGEASYQQAGAALDRQQRALEGLRNRSGIVLSSASVTTALFGGRTLVAGALHATSWLAIACFAVVAAASLAAMWPRNGLDITTRPPSMPALPNQPWLHSGALVHQTWARYLSVAYETNDRLIARIAIRVRTSVMFLAFEVLWWVVDLAVRA